MGANSRVTAASYVEQGGDLAAILTNLRACDILVIDDIHRLSKAAEEVLFPAMGNFILDIVVGKGIAAKTMRLSLPKFTVIGETTRIAMVTPELKSAFPVQYRLDFYDITDLIAIVRRAAVSMNISITDEE